MSDSNNNPDIQKFKSLIKSTTKTVEVELQNEIYRFMTSRKILVDIEKGQADRNVRQMCNRLSEKNGLDIESLTLLFNSNHVDGEGPNIITDKSGAIFWFHFGFGSPKVKYIADSIWNFLDDESKIRALLATPESTVFISKLQPVNSFVSESKVIKFDIQGFLIDDYQSQLTTLFAQSDGALTLADFESDWIRKSIGEMVSIQINVNSLQFTIQLEKSKWYDFNFPAAINKLLLEMHSKFRLCFVHENSWDQTHGIMLGTINEYEALKANRLIVGV